MKIFIYKTLFVFILIYILFQLTIGLTIKKIKEEIYNFKSKENIELIKKKDEEKKREEEGTYINIYSI